MSYFQASPIVTGGRDHYHDLLREADRQRLIKAARTVGKARTGSPIRP